MASEQSSSSGMKYSSSSNNWPARIMPCTSPRSMAAQGSAPRATDCSDNSSARASSISTTASESLRYSSSNSDIFHSYLTQKRARRLASSSSPMESSVTAPVYRIPAAMRG